MLICKVTSLGLKQYLTEALDKLELSQRKLAKQDKAVQQSASMKK
jgi:hypothetical protein